MWEELRNKKLNGKKFYKQYTFFYDLNGKETFFVADFYCHSEKLIIEIDGEYHKDRLKADNDRFDVLNYLGLSVIRFKNDEVMNKIKDVLSTIEKQLLNN